MCRARVAASWSVGHRLSPVCSGSVRRTVDARTSVPIDTFRTWSRGALRPPSCNSSRWRLSSIQWNLGGVFCRGCRVTFALWLSSRRARSNGPCWAWICGRARPWRNLTTDSTWTKILSRGVSSTDTVAECRFVSLSSYQRFREL